MRKGWKRVLATALAVVMVATSSNAWSMQVVAEGADATVSDGNVSEPTPDVTEPTPDVTEPTPEVSEPTPENADPVPDVEPVAEEGAQEPKGTVPTDVVVTITGNSATFTWDGEIHSVSGYSVSISDSSYTEADFSFDGNAEVSGTDEGTYNMGLSADDFTNTNEKFNAQFAVTDGVLTIEKATEPVVEGSKEEPAPVMMKSTAPSSAKMPLTITTGSAEKEYDGTALTADDALEVTAEGLADGHWLDATLSASILNAGTVANKLDEGWSIKDEDFNDVTDQYDVTIVEGTLTINPIEEMVYVVIKANNLGIFSYTGEEQVVTADMAWSFQNVSNPLYTKSDYEYRGEEIVARGTEGGTYPFALDKSAWVNINPNFKNVTFAVGEGQMEIGGSGVLMGGGSDSEYYAIVLADGTKMYDGTPLIVHDYWDIGLADVGYTAKFTWDETSQITEVGSVENKITDFKVYKGKNYENYVTNHTEVFNGLLTVTPRTGVTVTITPKSETVEYDGNSHTLDLSNYEVSISDAGGLDDLYTVNDFKVKDSANLTVTGTLPGNYTITADMFENTNENFADVKFVVADGGLTIDGQMPLTIKTESASKEYDGKPLTAGATATGLAEGHTFECTTTEITDAGKAVNEVLTWDIKDASGNSVKSLYAEPEVVNGYLEVTPRNVVLYIQGTQILRGYEEGVSYTYGDRDENGDYTFAVKILDDIYTEEDYEYVGNVSITASEKGVHYVPMTEEMFVNKNPNFYLNVCFMSKPSLQIQTNQWGGGSNGDPLYAYAGSSTKEYDGTPLTNSDVRVFRSWNGTEVENVTAVMTAASTRTDAGSTENVISSLSVTHGDGIVKYNGTLTVLPRTGVTVTIIPKDKTVYETGTAQTVDFSDYDISVKDAGGLHDLYKAEFIENLKDITITETEVGTYNLKDYVTAKDFENISGNFEGVTFVIADGGLTIKEREKVTVTITGNTSTVEYANKSQSVSGYEVSIDNANYTEADFTFTGTASATGTTVGTYNMGLKASQFVNNNEAFDVTFVVTDGSLTVNPVTDKITVTIKGHSDTVTYDGTEHNVGGYDVVIDGGNGLFTTDDIVFSGNDAVKGTDAGTYTMELLPSDFTENNPNFDNVEFVIDKTGGQLVIEQRDKVTVQIAEASDSKVYNGAKQSIEGYEVTSISDSLYKETDFTFKGTAVAEGTTAGFYDMDLAASDFTNSNTNFKTVDFVITDGQLEITPITEEVVVTVTENSGAFTYDGEEKSVEGYTVTSISNSLYTADDFTYSGEAIAKGTRAGSYPMNVKASEFINNSENFADVRFEVVDGFLTITASADEVVVYIAGNTLSPQYNGGVQSVEGYTVTSISNPLYTEDDFAFSGNAIATGTNVGGYSMGLEASQFTNTNPDFTNVTFVVTDGVLNITKNMTPITITVIGNGESFEYDGTEKTVSGYEVEIEGGDGLFTEDDVIYKGGEEPSASRTDIGESSMGIKEDDFTVSENFGNVTIEVVPGSDVLEITAMTGVVVTITGTSGTFVYDGTEKKVEGYEISVEGKGEGLYTKDMVTFDGEAVAKGTEPGEYFMDILAEQFGNSNANFTDVKFVIDTEGGKLAINGERATLTIHYVDTNGKKMADDYVAKYFEGDSFKVVSPSINGYTPDYASISNSADGMPAQDIEITVTYKANPVTVPDDDGDDEDDSEEESTEEETTEEPIEEEVMEEEPVAPAPAPAPADDDDEDDDEEEPWTPAPRNDPPAETPVREQAAAPAADNSQEPIVQIDESLDMEVSVDENGLLTLTPIGDGESPLAGWGWGDDGSEHACNIANFLMMLASLVIYLSYTKRMKKLQARVFELNGQLGYEQAEN